MSFWSRIVNVFRGDRINRDLGEELASHINEAIEHGRDPAEARRAFGSPLRHCEESYDIRLIPWFDSLRADAVFGWRQLKKKKVTSAAAILSLALAIGACTSAFRLIDALFLRPLPVAEPQRLYVLSRQGFSDRWEYRVFRRLRASVKNQATLIAVMHERADLTYTSDQEMEKAHVQYVSGWMFESFGLRPTLGRLFTEADDFHPGAHPVAVLSYDYWTHRLGQDPKVIGRTFRMGSDIFQIIGVGPESFTGTEPGTVTGIFVPTMMQSLVNAPVAAVFRTFVHLRPGAAIEPVRDRLRAALRAVNEKDASESHKRPNQVLLIEQAAAGVSGIQKDYRQALGALAVLVALVLLIACANVANLMTAQGAARSREMALRVSLGAGGGRLVQLVLVESAMLAILAAAAAVLFAGWAAPFVVASINPPDNPARLLLAVDWRVLGFDLALTLAVTFLFGLAPALRASRIKPASALKGGDDSHARRHLMHALIAVQAAFCFLVLFAAGLFVATFDRLSHEPTGFVPARLLALDSVTQRDEPPAAWEQVTEHLRTVPGVETAALSEWPLLDGHSYRYNAVSVDGAPPSGDPTWLIISPGWVNTMRIPFLDGRDFRANDANVAIVNQAFARQYFRGENPVGKSFDGAPCRCPLGRRFKIVGLVGDARYRLMREPALPTAYIPFEMPWNRETFMVRTWSANPLAIASMLRQEVARARPGFRVSNIRTQEEIIQSQTVRERLLAILAMFFAGVALLLAGIGMYGMLDYSVLQRRREIGIRMAIGAQAGEVARRVTSDVFVMVVAGAVAGIAIGMAAVRYIETLLYQVKGTDSGVLVLPSLAILAAALLAALPAVIRAVRIDPVQMLRSE